ncbi:MAG: 4-alpha-glucanotransferase [Rhodobacteraceae bacterium]|nr:4-alpha-glucanotransferase [Paracoccaceae bacterium]
MTDPVLELAEAMGVLADYHGLDGQRWHTSHDTALALLAAMDCAVSGPREADERLAAVRAGRSARRLPDWHICLPGEAPGWAGPDDLEWQLTCEDGTRHEGRGALPPLPLGLHRLSAGGERMTLLCAPKSLPVPARCWGITAPLAGLRTPEQGGVGDYADLARAARGAARHGAAFLGINPVHAGLDDRTDSFSPYAPTHRRRFSTLHIACRGGVGDAGGPLIDYAGAVPARQARLRAAFDAAGDDPAFAAFRRREGQPLADFALHQALSAHHGPFWTDWPAALHDPAGAAARAAAGQMADAVAFHAWMQWRAETQLADAADAARGAGMARGLYLDLAVGTHPAGAETWQDRASFAYGASLGAPPDPFAPEGQAWNLAPFNPQALVAQGFAALAETLRKQLQFAGVLRIDHVLGFERAFWVPLSGGAPGGYVRMPRDAMLAVARIEAARAGAVVIGEDLGVVPEGLQQALAASGILGCRLAMFERHYHGDGSFKRPHEYDSCAIASFGTHDLPSFRGWRAGVDIDARAALHRLDGPAADEARARRGGDVAAFDAAVGAPSGMADDSAATDAMHRFLGQSAARLVAVQAEDVFGMTVQANLPGTVNEHPNWRHRLPLAPDAWEFSGDLARTGQILKETGRQETTT